MMLSKRPILLPFLAAVILLGAALTIKALFAQHTAKKHEIAYQAQLNAYVSEFKPGETRKSVADRLHARNIFPANRCCYEEHSAYAEMIKIGEEPAPFFCNQSNVFVVLEFRATHISTALGADESDVLTHVHLVHQLKSCL